MVLAHRDPLRLVKRRLPAIASTSSSVAVSPWPRSPPHDPLRGLPAVLSSSPSNATTSPPASLQATIHDLLGCAARPISGFSINLFLLHQLPPADLEFMVTNPYIFIVPIQTLLRGMFTLHSRTKYNLVYPVRSYYTVLSDFIYVYVTIPQNKHLLRSVGPAWSPTQPAEALGILLGLLVCRIFVEIVYDRIFKGKFPLKPYDLCELRPIFMSNMHQSFISKERNNSLD